MLTVERLRVQYAGQAPALDSIDMTVGEAECVALFGSNGSGKTTLMRTLTGTLRRHRGKAVSGTVTLNGEDLLTHPAASLVRRGITQVPEGRRVFPSLSVRDNLRVGGIAVRSRRARRDTLSAVIDQLPPLHPHLHRPAGVLSGGQQQLLAIGRALMASPRLLLMDEPSMGLSPVAVRDVIEVIHGIRRAGTSVLIADQSVATGHAVASRAYVLTLGRMTSSGAIDDVVGGEAFASSYFGTSGAPR